MDNPEPFPRSRNRVKDSSEEFVEGLFQPASAADVGSPPFAQHVSRSATEALLVKPESHTVLFTWPCPVPILFDAHDLIREASTLMIIATSWDRSASCLQGSLASARLRKP